MNEQERSRLIERIVENRIDESERASLLRQAESDPHAQQELIAEHAIARAVARDRQQLPIPSMSPSPRLMEALSNAPAVPQTAVGLLWGGGGSLVGVSFMVVIVIGAVLLLFPSLLWRPGAAAPGQQIVTPTVVIDSSQVSSPTTPVGILPSVRKDQRNKRSGVVEPATAKPEETKAQGSVEAATTRPNGGEATPPTEPKPTTPELPVQYENNGTMFVNPE